MIKEAIATGTSVEEAKENACAKLGIMSEDVHFEIIDLPEKKLLGLFGGKLAKVRAYVLEESAGASSEDAQKDVKQTDEADVNNKQLCKDCACVSSEKTKNKNASEDITEVKEVAVNCARQVLLHMLDDPSSIDVNARDAEGGIQVQIYGDNLSFMIGHKGETLYSLQYIISLMVRNKLKHNTCKIYLDVSDYREKRKETLTALALRKAKLAKKAHKKVWLEPMSAYERRIMHCAIQNKEGVTSWSEGEGNKRHVVIAPSDMKNKVADNFKPSGSKNLKSKDNDITQNTKIDGESPLYSKVK